MLATVTQATEKSAWSLRDVSCSSPYDHIEILNFGEIMQCCKTWLPKPIGNILETDILTAIHGKIAQDVRDSVEDGSYRFCDHQKCPNLSRYLHFGEADRPLSKKTNLEIVGRGQWLTLVLNYDQSCNLTCPSCRKEKMLYRAGELPPLIQGIHDATLRNIRLIREAGIGIDLYVTGGGDAFASPTYYQMLRDMPFDPGIRLGIKSNGVLMTPLRFTETMMKMTDSLSISIDAATKETYAKVRRGGNFEAVRNNIQWMDRAVREGKFPALKDFQINFVAQKDNYQEMAEFARWAAGFPAVNVVFFSLIADWGHNPQRVYESSAVWQTWHPEYRNFLRHAQDPFLRENEKVRLGDMSAYANPVSAPSPAPLLSALRKYWRVYLTHFLGPKATALLDWRPPPLPRSSAFPDQLRWRLLSLAWNLGGYSYGSAVRAWYAYLRRYHRIRDMYKPKVLKPWYWLSWTARELCSPEGRARFVDRCKRRVGLAS